MLTCIKCQTIDEEGASWRSCTMEKPGNIDLRSLAMPFHPLSDFGEIV
jgi:hypothetical protein